MEVKNTGRLIKPSEQFWKVFKETPGALSTAEAIAIMNVAALAPSGIYMELGTHKGKSAMAALISLKEKYSGVGDTPKFILVDPIFEDEVLATNVLASVKEATQTKVPLLTAPKTSLEVINTFEIYVYVFVDSGSHGDGLPMKEAKMLERKIKIGGIISFHDYRNQFVEVEQAYNYLLSTGKYEEVKINWNEIFEYVKENNLEEGNNSWHTYPDLPHPPNFVGALKRIK